MPGRIAIRPGLFVGIGIGIGIEDRVRGPRFRAERPTPRRPTRTLHAHPHAHPLRAFAWTVNRGTLTASGPASASEWGRNRYRRSSSRCGGKRNRPVTNSIAIAIAIATPIPMPMPIPVARHTRRNHANHRQTPLLPPRPLAASSFLLLLLLRFCGFAQKHCLFAFASSQKRHILR